MRLRTIFENSEVKVISASSSYDDPFINVNDAKPGTFHDADEFQEDSENPKASVMTFNDGVKVYEYTPRDYDWPEFRFVKPNGEIFKVHEYADAEKIGMSQYMDVLHNSVIFDQEHEFTDLDVNEFRKVFGK